jgi:hypothetical protein
MLSNNSVVSQDLIAKIEIKDIQFIGIEINKKTFDDANSILRVLAAELEDQAKLNNNTEKEELK